MKEDPKNGAIYRIHGTVEDSTVQMSVFPSLIYICLAQFLSEVQHVFFVNMNKMIPKSGSGKF